MSSIIKKNSSWALCLSAIGVLFLACVAMGQVFASMEVGDKSGDDFVGFVFIIFFYGLVLSFVGIFFLVKHKRRVSCLPEDLNRKELSWVLNVFKADPSPFIAVIRGMHDQFRRNPKAVDADTLIELFHRRLSVGPRRIIRAGNLSISLGFIGTAYGLLHCLDGLSRAASAAGGDGARLMELLFSNGGPMAALGGAYLSTLVALCCGGVVLRALANVQQDGIDNLVDEFTEIVSLYVKPSFRKQRIVRSDSKRSGEHSGEAS